MKKTVLIFGISSFVGSNLAHVLKDEFRVVGTYHKTPVDIPGVTCLPCDVLKREYVLKLTGIIKPHFTIYSAGLSSLTECKLKPKEADALNSVGAINVSSAAERYGAKFVFISSCYVLGGDDVSYQESDTPMPITIYGSHLSSTEFYVQRSSLNYLILRCSPLYGRSFNPWHPNWFEVVQSQLVKNESILADDHVETGYLDIHIFAKIIKILLASDVTNRLFQISSSDNVTRFNFARMLAKTFRKDENLIQRHLIPFPAEVNHFSAQGSPESPRYYFKMDTGNIESFLGMKMPTVEESMLTTFKRLKQRSINGKSV